MTRVVRQSGCDSVALDLEAGSSLHFEFVCRETVDPQATLLTNNCL